jgi:hypothetical protein
MVSAPHLFYAGRAAARGSRGNGGVLRAPPSPYVLFLSAAAWQWLRGMFIAAWNPEKINEIGV